MAVSQAEPSQQVQTKLHLLSSKSTTSFMSRELHQQTLDQYLSLARGQHQSKMMKISDLYFLDDCLICRLSSVMTLQHYATVTLQHYNTMTLTLRL